MSAGWADGRMLALDFESDGKDPLTARAVQVACVEITPADPGVAEARAVGVDRWATLINPGDDFEMNPEAQAVHGISIERIRAEGRPTHEVLPEVAERLYRTWAAGGVVVGHNCSYDASLLSAELVRAGFAALEVRGAFVDTYCLDKCDLLERSDRFRKNTDLAPDGQPVGSRKLVDAVRWWRVSMNEAMAHDATEDALASARIAWRMCQRYPALADMTAEQLHAYQAEQYAKQAESLEKHIRKTKAKEKRPQAEIDDVHINRDWPIQSVSDRKEAA